MYNIDDLERETYEKTEWGCVMGLTQPPPPLLPLPSPLPSPPLCSMVQSSSFPLRLKFRRPLQESDVCSIPTLLRLSDDALRLHQLKRILHLVRGPSSL
jgi:hypothetical protein